MVVRRIGQRERARARRRDTHEREPVGAAQPARGVGRARGREHARQLIALAARDEREAQMKLPRRWEPGRRRDLARDRDRRLALPHRDAREQRQRRRERVQAAEQLREPRFAVRAGEQQREHRLVHDRRARLRAPRDEPIEIAAAADLLDQIDRRCDRDEGRWREPAGAHDAREHDARLGVAIGDASEHGRAQVGGGDRAGLDERDHDARRRAPDRARVIDALGGIQRELDRLVARELRAIAIALHGHELGDAAPQRLAREPAGQRVRDAQRHERTAERLDPRAERGVVVLPSPQARVHQHREMSRRVQPGRGGRVVELGVERRRRARVTIELARDVGQRVGAAEQRDARDRARRRCARGERGDEPGRRRGQRRRERVRQVAERARRDRVLLGAVERARARELARERRHHELRHAQRRLCPRADIGRAVRGERARHGELARSRRRIRAAERRDQRARVAIGERDHDRREHVGIRGADDREQHARRTLRRRRREHRFERIGEPAERHARDDDRGDGREPLVARAGDAQQRRDQRLVAAATGQRGDERVEPRARVGRDRVAREREVARHARRLDAREPRELHRGHLAGQHADHVPSRLARDQRRDDRVDAERRAEPAQALRRKQPRDRDRGREIRRAIARVAHRRQREQRLDLFHAQPRRPAVAHEPRGRLREPRAGQPRVAEQPRVHRRARREHVRARIAARDRAEQRRRDPTRERPVLVRRQRGDDRPQQRVVGDRDHRVAYVAARRRREHGRRGARHEVRRDGLGVAAALGGEHGAQLGGRRRGDARRELGVGQRALCVQLERERQVRADPGQRAREVGGRGSARRYTASSATLVTSSPASARRRTSARG